MATTGMCAAFSRSSTVSAVGVIAKSLRLAVRVKLPGCPTNGRAMTRPRPCPPTDQFERDVVDAVLLFDGNDVLVRGDLKHAVGRGVDDRLARAHVFGAEVVDDFRARRGVIAKRAAADALLERVDQLLREPVREHGKRAIEHDAHHLPVSRDRVLPLRRFGHAADRRLRRLER